VEAVPDGPGAFLVHSILLRSSSAGDRLYALDAFLGNVWVFDRDGKLVLQSTLSNPQAEGVVQQIRIEDQSNKEKGQRSLKSLLFWQGIEFRDDILWSISEADHVANRVTFVGLGMSKPDRLTRVVETRCPSRKFTFWQGQIVFFRPPHGPMKMCVDVIERSKLKC
jgi:hypothetical protein